MTRPQNAPLRPQPHVRIELDTAGRESLYLQAVANLNRRQSVIARGWRNHRARRSGPRSARKGRRLELKLEHRSPTAGPALPVTYGAWLERMTPKRAAAVRQRAYLPRRVI